MAQANHFGAEMVEETGIRSFPRKNFDSWSKNDSVNP
jgi:hypothetical protein